MRITLRKLALVLSIVWLAASPLQAAEPVRPLSERGLDNLVAFTRLLGYVRYFHPSDEAAGADWEAIALAGVPAAEAAEGPEALARTLEDLVRPVAPSVRVFPTGRPPAVPAELAPPPGSTAPKVTAWSHYGVTLSKEPSIYQSRRIDNKSSGAEGFGNLMQGLDATPYRGKTIRLRAAVRAEVEGEDRAQMWLRVDRPDQQRGFFDNMDDRPIRDREWRTYEITGDVAEDATGIVFGIMLLHKGRVWVDDVSLEIVGEEEKATDLANPGFEAGAPGSEPPGWGSPRQRGPRPAYSVVLDEKNPRTGRLSALLSYTEPPKPVLPDPRKPFEADLGGGVSALIPLALYVDAFGTRPPVPGEVKPPAPPEGWVPSGNDRTTRLAGVALAWNVFQHFYPYFDVVGTDWPAALRQALRGAATDPNERAFLDTLRRLVAQLHDGHGRVNHPSAPTTHRLPLRWDWVEDRLVVTHIEPEDAGGLARGDVILRLDGRPVEAALAAESELISSATPQYRRFRAVLHLLLGKENEEVRIEAQRPGGEIVTATLHRSVKADGPLSLRGSRSLGPEKIAELRPGIFYLDLNRITDEDFQGALDRLATARGIVFDLRGYPSNISPVVLTHLTDDTLTSARWQVPTVTRPDFQDVEYDRSNWTLQPAAPRLRAKVAFLTDGQAISYAESLLGIVEHYKLAEIVGAPTAGTNGNINPFKLPGEYTIWWTGMRVDKHNGSRHHGVGILPTVPVSRTLKGVAEGRDEVLEKAIEVVSR